MLCGDRVGHEKLVWEKHCVKNSYHDITSGVGLRNEVIALVEAYKLWYSSGVELIADLREDREDAVEGFQGLGLDQDKAGGEALDDGVIGVEDLRGVRNRVEGVSYQWPCSVKMVGILDLAMWMIYISYSFSCWKKCYKANCLGYRWLSNLIHIYEK